jgi:uncharacterized membrane protein
MENTVLILLIVGVLFWLSELAKLLDSKISKREKALWFILFFVGNILTAIVHWFVRRK